MRYVAAKVDKTNTVVLMHALGINKLGKFATMLSKQLFCKILYHQKCTITDYLLTALLESILVYKPIT